MKNSVKWTPEKNSLVRVCYDGKIGRVRIGKVIEIRGFVIKVEFTPVDYSFRPKEGTVSMWFTRTSNESFGGYHRSNNSFMKRMFKTEGDWYSVYPMDTSTT